MDLTATVMDRVAEKEGCDPLELPPLWENIDAEALEQTIESTEAPIAVQIRYCWYSITIQADDTVTITIADEEEGRNIAQFHD